MKVRSHHSPLSGSLNAALAEFEEDFTYPLGDSARFRISHGDDYMAFFRAMGDAVAVLSGDEERVDGCIVRVKRPLLLDGRDHGMAHYLCDLKVRRGMRSTAVLARLLGEMKSGIAGDGGTVPHHRCYCVVMDGTGRLPTDYTGRVGIPPFVKAGEIMVLRLSLKKGAVIRSGSTREGDLPDITMPGYRITGGDSRLRSAMEPVHLVAPDGGACGILEDTRKAKRLFLGNGGELLSAHVSAFAYRHPAAGARVLMDAVALASSGGIPAVFVAVPVSEVGRLLPELGGLDVLQSAASVFSHGMEAGHGWWIDTAEI